MSPTIRLLSFSLLLAGCGTETGNPDGDLTFSYNARTSNPDRVSLREDGTDSRVDEVWLRLDDVVIQGCDIEEPEVLDSIGFADHGGDAPAQQTSSLSDTTYCGLQTRFILGAADGEADDVAGASFAIKGTLADSRSFLVRLDREVELELDLANIPVDLAPRWLFSFDVATWIDPDELAALSGEPVVVDATTNSDVLEAIEARIAEGVQLFADTDGDGQLGAAEARLDR